MKPRSLLPIAICGFLSAIFLTTPKAHGATVGFSFDNINQPIPDGSLVGWSDSRTIATNFTVIESVIVALNITGGFNGDLYAYLTHGSGFSVLLNRVGRSAQNPVGYSDSGMNVQFDDSTSTAGDVHTYRTTLFGNETTPLGGPLTGTWKPDGRAVDPAQVVDTDPRTATLSSFNGLDPNGEWTLFIADLDGGGQSTVQSWGLTVQVIPEPGTGTMLLVSLSWFCGFGRLRRGGRGFPHKG